MNRNKIIRNYYTPVLSLSTLSLLVAKCFGYILIVITYCARNQSNNRRSDTVITY